MKRKEVERQPKRRKRLAALSKSIKNFGIQI